MLLLWRLMERERLRPRSGWRIKFPTGGWHDHARPRSMILDGCALRTLLLFAGVKADGADANK